MKVVIVGGVAGGATAAARLRRLDEHAQIIVFERSGYVSYANCGLPYYIGGTIADPEALTLQTPESFRARFNVDMRVNHEATALDVQAKTVTVKNLVTGEVFKESYDKPHSLARCEAHAAAPSRGWEPSMCSRYAPWKTRSA